MPTIRKLKLRGHGGATHSDKTHRPSSAIDNLEKEAERNKKEHQKRLEKWNEEFKKKGKVASSVMQGVMSHLSSKPVSYTHLRAHETSLHLVCRLLLEKKKKTTFQRGCLSRTHRIIPRLEQNPY
eukprot:TRINITY_DN10763_c0_g1_i1.p2 TRINITY_DN10763_c0_g1~~TRINITY_DN10763_c0_g1_i1.p2  ORF type:complete len:125 (+),score=26.91 TRINITY_DN10763_c0_g1_i1:164-538(+)